MGILPAQCSGLILAGGHSRRMGVCKAQLSDGRETFLQRLAREMAFLPRLFLSAGRKEWGEGFPGERLEDLYSDAGPLAGLHSGLLAADTPFLLVVSCDMPNVTRKVLEGLLERMPSQVMALICADHQGRTHPFPGLYAKALLPELESYLERGGRSVHGFLAGVSCCRSQCTGFSEDVFANLNTPEEYRKWLESQGETKKK